MLDVMCIHQIIIAEFPIFMVFKFVSFSVNILNSKPSTQECPIKIIPKKTKPFTINSGLPLFAPSPINLGEVRIINTGSTIQIALKDDTSIALESNSFTYKFAHIHFHWSKSDKVNAETTIHKKRYLI